jgi:uncharacterized protein YjbJ (UPF0337 family)
MEALEVREPRYRSKQVPKEARMNWDQVEGRWTQLTNSAKENWAKLTDDDLNEISGKREQLITKLQEVYGITRKESDKQVWDWGKSVERTQKKIA